jgi:hypothetical protein
LRPALARIWHRRYVRALIDDGLIAALATRADSRSSDPAAQLPERNYAGTHAS